MTNTKTLMKTVGALAVSVLATVTLTACSGGSGGGSIEEFCATNTEFESTMTDLDPTDLGAVADTFSGVVDKMKGIDAPPEIADDWDVLAGAMEEMSTTIDGLKDLDPTDPSYLEKAQGMGTALTSEEVTTAGENVSKFTSENCKA